MAIEDLRVMGRATQESGLATLKGKDLYCGCYQRGKMM
jgi:hypothetical protein